MGKFVDESGDNAKVIECKGKVQDSHRKHNDSKLNLTNRRVVFNDLPFP